MTSISWWKVEEPDGLGLDGPVGKMVLCRTFEFKFSLFQKSAFAIRCSLIPDSINLW